MKGARQISSDTVSPGTMAEETVRQESPPISRFINRQQHTDKSFYFCFFSRRSPQVHARVPAGTVDAPQLSPQDDRRRCVVLPGRPGQDSKIAQMPQRRADAPWPALAGHLHHHPGRRSQDL